MSTVTATIACYEGEYLVPKICIASGDSETEIEFGHTDKISNERFEAFIGQLSTMSSDSLWFDTCNGRAGLVLKEGSLTFVSEGQVGDCPVKARTSLPAVKCIEAIEKLYAFHCMPRNDEGEKVYSV